MTTARSNEEIFLLEFVNKVEQNTCLYDKLHIDYGNKYKTEAVWNQIGEHFNLSAHECKNKWKMIRCSYTRSEHNKHKFKVDGSKKKEYYLSPYLAFLDPFTTVRPKDTAVVSVKTSESFVSDESMENKYESEVEDYSIAEEDNPLLEVQPQQESHIIQNINTHSERDPCELYLLSLIPHMRTMTTRQQLRFQIGVAELIEKIVYGNTDEQ